MSYQQFVDGMFSMGFFHDNIVLCLFIKQYDSKYVIAVIYVNNLNIFGMPKMIEDTILLLKNFVEMINLEVAKFCLGLQFHYFLNGVISLQ